MLCYLSLLVFVSSEVDCTHLYISETSTRHPDSRFPLTVKSLFSEILVHCLHKLDLVILSLSLVFLVGGRSCQAFYSVILF